MESKNHIFRPSVFTYPKLFGGHMQTIFSEIKDTYINLAYPKYFNFEYDFQEVFTFKDGGETLIDFKIRD